MEVKILEQGKDFVKVELVGEDHTLANALKDELNNDSHVTVSGYKRDHPLVGNPILVVKTDGKEDPIKAISACIVRLKKKNSELLAQVKKI